MIDEGKLRKQEERATRAKRLLENELLHEAFEKIDQTILERWKESGADDSEVRERAYLMHRLLGNLKKHFEQIVTTGDHAGKELLRIEKESKLKRIIHGGR